MLHLPADWIAYGTSHIGGTRCAPEVPYTGPLLNGEPCHSLLLSLSASLTLYQRIPGRPTFDAYTDVPSGGCTGQSAASWRIPVGIQILPAVVLGIGMFFMPYSPRWLVEVGRDEEARQTLSHLRSMPMESPGVVNEYLEIKAEVLIVREIRSSKSTGISGIGKLLQPYLELVSTRANFHRLAIGCLVMFYQQFIGCNVSSVNDSRGNCGIPSDAGRASPSFFRLLSTTLPQVR
jgi:hypothetical protein